jgi:hypothetical protein
MGLPSHVGRWNPVCDVGDRHIVDGALGPQVAPHLARDPAVAAADRVRRPAHAQRELGDAEGFALVVRSGTAEAHERRGIEAERGGERPQRVRQLLGGVGLVAGCDGRVRGEPVRWRAASRAVAAGTPRAPFGHGHLDRGERGVSLVEVKQRRLDAEGLPSARTPPRPSSAYWARRVTGSPA